MSDQTDLTDCSADIKEITINLPCRLAERAERYAKENSNTITGVVIEALDTFLRSKKLNLSGW